MKKNIVPKFSGSNNIPIVFSSNQAFVPVLSVMFQSVLEHSTKEHTYDVIVLTRDINSTYGKRLNSMLAGYDNFSLRIVDVSEYFDQYALYVANRPDITVETYFRLIIPELMEDYDKALYLDGDMVANVDVAELYAVDVDNFLLAASTDCDSIGCYHRPLPELKQYRDNVLKLKCPDQYFCAGALVMNLKELRKAYSSKELLELAASYEWRQHDQDVLNVIGQGRTKMLSPAWDLLRDAGNNQYMPKKLYQEFLEAEQDPKIIHYGGKRKPWIYFDVERGEYFWKYAGKTPFYREILSMVNDANIQRAPSAIYYQFQDKSRLKDEVLRQFSQGEIGFKYIIKYIQAWFKFKVGSSK